MEKYGVLIADYRKKSGMTQADLGAKLNVSAQAVSKWENGLSEPDLETLQKMSKLFNVSVDVLLGNAEVVAAEQPAEAKQNEGTVPQTPMIIVGYCDECKKPIYQSDKYEVERHRGGLQKIRCKTCHENIKAIRRNAEKSELASKRKKGFVTGGIISGAVFLASFVYAIIAGLYAELWVPFIVAYAVLAFVAQCFWGEFMLDFMEFFIKSLKFPGLIFTLDLDGIIWFICVKLLFGIIGFIFSVLFFLFGLLLAFIISMFSFPFALIKCNREIKSLS